MIRPFCKLVLLIFIVLYGTLEAEEEFSLTGAMSSEEFRELGLTKFSVTETSLSEHGSSNATLSASVAPSRPARRVPSPRSTRPLDPVHHHPSTAPARRGAGDRQLVPGRPAPGPGGPRKQIPVGGDPGDR